MPTPFYHLSVAKEILEHPKLPPEAGALINRERSAFLFGNTAPDVQTVSNQARQETHFFEVPLRKDAPPPWVLLVQRHAGLSNPEKLPPSQAAFIAGYLCHLQADWLWVREIFLPVFGKRASWESFSRRLYIHNVLRTYLDQEILPSLTNGTATNINQAHPLNWLPFVADTYLYHWRNYLAEQLHPGAKVETVEVFAARQGISPQEYYHLLASSERMEAEVFSRLPKELLDHYRGALIEENLRLIQVYMESSTSLAD